MQSSQAAQWVVAQEQRIDRKEIETRSISTTLYISSKVGIIFRIPHERESSIDQCQQKRVIQRQQGEHIRADVTKPAAQKIQDERFVRITRSVAFYSSTDSQLIKNEPIGKEYCLSCVARTASIRVYDIAHFSL